MPPVTRRAHAAHGRCPRQPPMKPWGDIYIVSHLLPSFSIGRLALAYYEHGAKPASVSPTPGPRIYWRTVAVVGASAWLLVAAIVGACVLRQRSAEEPRVSLKVLPKEVITSPSAIMEKPSPQKQEAPKPPVAPAASPETPHPVMLAKITPPVPPTALFREDRIASAPLLPSSEQPLPQETTDFERCGTQVDFASNPSDAARLALKERKLLLVLHLSGEFEDSKFT